MTTFFSWLLSYWYLALPLVLGFIAMATLLPQAGRRYLSHRVGLAFAIVAMTLAGLLLVRSSGRVSLDFFFYVFAALAIASAGAMIVQRNPVYSALNFALVVLGVCGLFVVKNAAFLAAATIIVYTGAIIVTFLFVIMLAQQTGLADYDRRSREAVLGCIAGFVLLGALLFVIEKNFMGSSAVGEVKAALAQAREMTAADRYRRPGAEILEVLQISGRPAEAVMNQQIDRLPAWPQANQARERADREWAMVRGLLARNKTHEAHASLASLEAIADEVQDASDRYSGLLSAQATGGAGQSTLSRIRITPRILKNENVPEKQQVPNERVDRVNELGRTLFGDYLYAVELAGTLLLVATLAAILIAQQHPQLRRKEALS